MPGLPPAGDPAPPDGSLPAQSVAALGGRDFGVYVHVPFCATRCGYCDFNTYTAAELGGAGSAAGYADVAQGELRLAGRVLGDRVPPARTVFFGGGTPTTLPAGDLIRLLRAVESLVGLAPGAEVTTEANPESVDLAYLEALRAAGFTRLSLGMQSARPHVLATLDRRHTPGRVQEVVGAARRAGFAQVSVDLIYGTPGESEADWQASLDAALAAGVDHVSAYALIVEDGTRLARQVARGELPAPDDDVLADRYEQADQAFSAAGMAWYEVSNWAAAPASRCRHNELYWAGGDWWGIGPGAHSHVAGTRWWNVRHPAAYAERIASGLSPAQAREVLSPADRRLERVLLGIRRRVGLPLSALTDSGRAAAGRACADGLLEPADHEAGRAVLTLRGRLLSDAVVRALLD
ncbi:MAG: radical SAM family heme chaperone HemW [Actinomycetota bacterium]|nr:radical SAM family heme chaperone HemW [Actinomycetota bacterium]